MDELEISGKRYLSSKRAAKEHKYHADYIGQLIRAGKVVGTKVGRAWYVEAVSLDEYLANESATTHSVSVPQTTRQHSISIQPRVIQSTDKTFSLSVKKEPPHIQIESSASPVEKTQTLRYVADEGPVFPVIQKTSHIFDAREFAHTSPKIMPQASVRNSYTRKKLSVLTLIVAAVLAGGVTFAVVLFTSANLFSTVVVEQGKPAAVGFSFE